jgi:chitinase
MKEFTALKSNKLQTWIAVGGYDFSDKGTTWSDMCSTQASRAAFIQSTISFMDEYGFQGLVRYFPSSSW